uniref:FAS1 domain-containing protein n=1 Tax=Lotus japonicus TaxID=34305 RepID=I3SS63_LOTJA|nr:unknown [Lotus japonicus]
MAFSKPLALILLTFLSLFASKIQAQAPAPAPSGPVNLTAILEKAGQYTTLIRLLKESQQLTQIESQLNSTTQGFTLFAPTDNAFQNLKSGAINDLTDDQKVKLILYHVTPKYYSLSDLQTVSNPVRTQASEKEGSWGLNFKGQGNQVNVTTGVVTTSINNDLRQQFPLAIYQVDRVLLPLELFGAKSPSSAPSPKSSETTPSDETPSSGKKGGAPSPAASQKDNGVAGRNVGLGLVLGLGFICMGALS